MVNLECVWLSWSGRSELIVGGCGQLGIAEC